MADCVVQGCPNQARTLSAELCEKHYYRLRRTGTTADPAIIKGQCIVHDCEAFAEYKSGDPGRGYCRKHHLRRKNRGDVDFEFRGANNNKWSGDAASYSAVHHRLRSQRGRASNHDCADCGQPARQWSYDRTDPDPKFHKGAPYSVDLDRYVPRCVPCHKRFDLAAIS